MWKRDESVRSPASGRDQAAAPPPAAPAAGTSGSQAHRADSEARRYMEKDIINIGKSVVIKGELNGSEDLTVEGNVEGKIELRENVLTIGPHGKIKAEVFAKAVVVLGEVTGNIIASEKVDIRENGSVDGNIIAPRVAIAEGAHFRGSVDMQRKPQAAAAAEPKAEAKAPVTPPQAVPGGQRAGA